MRFQRSGETDIFRHSPSDIQTAGFAQTTTRYCCKFHPFLQHPLKNSCVQYDRDGTRLCVLLKCQTDEGMINVYRYLRAHEHRSNAGRMLADGEIVSCLRNIIPSNSSYLEQSTLSNSAVISMTLPVLTPPSPIKLSRDQWQTRRAEIKKISRESLFSPQSSPFSASTVITPVPRLSFAQQ